MGEQQNFQCVVDVAKSSFPIEQSCPLVTKGKCAKLSQQTSKLLPTHVDQTDLNGGRELACQALA